MTEISKELRDHFLHPRRRGEMDDPDGTGIVGNARCGDILSFQIKVKDNRIEQIRFQCLGCGAAKAVASYIAELAEGKKLEEIERMKMEDIFHQLEALPKSKWHCPFQAVDALQMAVLDYRNRTAGGVRKTIEVQPVAQGGRCPFCKEILGADLDMCQDCELRPTRCTGCGNEVLLKKGKD